MSYLNDQVGYREELLATRSVIKKENYVLLEPDGLVKNSIPGYENCDVTILGSPAMGATFADYLVTVKEGGKTAALAVKVWRRLFMYWPAKWLSRMPTRKRALPRAVISSP